MMKKCTLDAETRSSVNLMTRGAALYFESPTTDVLMLSYSFDGKRVSRWLPHEPCPHDLREYVESSGVMTAHNASFERRLWNKILVPKYGFPPARHDQWRCTMATASALGLPRSLDALGKALGLTVRKDKTGTDLIHFFSVPKARDASGNPIFNEPKDHKEKFEQFRDYCDVDVLSEAEADERMIPLSDYEQNVWLMDQKINERGMLIDHASVESASPIIDVVQRCINTELRILTDGCVQSCSEIAKIAEWLKARGVVVDKLDKDAIKHLLERPDISGKAREALSLRQEYAKSSTAKLAAFKNRVSSDGRLRDVFTYHGTGPGRWTSSGGVNVANLPRPRESYANAKINTEILFGSLQTVAETGDPELLRLLYGQDIGRPLDLVSDALRAFIWAAPGHDIIAVDYSNIQSCVAVWLANEEWKIQAFNEIFADPSNVPDMYRRAAAKMTGLSTDVITKKHHFRQIGKVAELACGFGGGVSAFYAMSKNYGVELDSLYEPTIAISTDEAIENAEAKYDRAAKARDKRRTDVMTRNAWLACSLIVSGWRAANPATVELWKVLEKAARKAIQNPGEKQQAGKVTYLVAHGYLFCRLPSGRCISYPAPKLKDQVWARIVNEDGSIPDAAEVVERDLAEKLEQIGLAKIEGETSAKITVLGSEGKGFRRYALYGGLQLENCCLAIERDVLVNGMFKCEEAGYPIIMHVYDELCAEVPHSFGSVDEMSRLMLDVPAWANGLPLAADGWRGKRYRK